MTIIKLKKSADMCVRGGEGDCMNESHQCVIHLVRE